MSGISVALCTYNGDAWVGKQLESILSQTLLPNEIVVSDDGSTDGTLAQVRNILSRRRMLGLGIEVTILTRAQPLGVSGNFEAAMLACSGDYIVLCDQDDVWHERKVEKLLAAFTESQILLVHSDARLVDSAGRPIGSSLFATLGARRRELRAEQGERGFEVLLRRNLVTGATAMVRASLVKEASPFPEMWVHDHWLAVVASLIGRIRVVVEPLIDYRQHGGNQIGVTRLTPGRAASLLGESRQARHDGRVTRIKELFDRIEEGSLPATPRQREMVKAKLTHEIRRLNLPESRWRRIPGVFAEWVTGRYRRLSRGLIDVVRDLWSPS